MTVGVTVHGDRQVMHFAAVLAGRVVPAQLTTTGIQEYLSLDLAVRCGRTAWTRQLAHIRRWGHRPYRGDRDQVDSRPRAGQFTARGRRGRGHGQRVDRGSPTASEFGFGAEIGISTQKLHARGPMGLAELTSTKYVLLGTGQIRASS